MLDREVSLRFIVYVFLLVTHYLSSVNIFLFFLAQINLAIKQEWETVRGKGSFELKKKKKKKPGERTIHADRES